MPLNRPITVIVANEVTKQNYTLMLTCNDIGIYQKQYPVSVHFESQ